MNRCIGTTGWAYFSKICEIIIIKILLFSYGKRLYTSYKNEQYKKFEFLDWILISLSILQIILFMFFLIFGFYFGLILISIVAKFTQNFLVSGILLYQILTWNKVVISYEVVKYSIFTMLIIDVLSFVFGFSFEFSFLEKYQIESNVINFLVALSFTLNVCIVSYAVYKNLDERDEGKSLNLIVEDQNNLNDLFQKFASGIKKMKKYYMIIVIIFTLSFFVQLYSNLMIDQEIIIINKINTENNSTQNSTYIENPLLDNEDFGFMDYFICMISFFFKDIAPHIYIYLALFIYKPSLESRNGSFIELI